MRLAPQSSGVNRPAPSRLGRGGINPQKQDCYTKCEQQYQTCEVLCKELYGYDGEWADCHFGCTIGWDICIDTCTFGDGPFLRGAGFT
jgi:hypothetical protein